MNCHTLHSDPDPKPDFSIYLKDEAESLEVGADIAFALKGGMLIFLKGDLGAGKTTLARAIIRQLVGDKEYEVPSPTYSIVQSYEGSKLSGVSQILHSDLYRISSGSEIYELGLTDNDPNQLVLVEWPENSAHELGEPDLVLSLTDKKEGRLLEISGKQDSVALANLERSVVIRSFLNERWEKNLSREKLFGDASVRSYEKVSNESETRILMNAPRQADGPILRDGKPYSQIAHLAEDVSAFVGVGNILTDAGLSAPALFAEDLNEGLLLLEDLGGETIIDEKWNPIESRYKLSAEMLAHFHSKDFNKSSELSDGTVYEVPDYSRKAMLIEVELLLDWYAPRMKGRPLLQSEKESFLQIWNDLIDVLQQSEKLLCIRDYHSPNIIWLPKRKGIQKIGVIDFQDAVIGPAAYDVASLAQDARVNISPSLENTLIEHYISTRNKIDANFNSDDFKLYYPIMAAQRVTKILGIFIRLDERDGKTAYLKHLPRCQEYISRSLDHPALKAYKKWYSSVMEM